MSAAKILRFAHNDTREGAQNDTVTSLTEQHWT
jgi:hypothetical protein